MNRLLVPTPLSHFGYARVKAQIGRIIECCEELNPAPLTGIVKRQQTMDDGYREAHGIDRRDKQAGFQP